MSFERWSPQKEFDSIPASATIVQSRLIRLTQPAANLLKLRGKSNAQLYYDKKRKVIGIKPLETRQDGTAKFRQTIKSTSIDVPSFFLHYQSDEPGIKRFHCW